jgi:hypothetical protein
LNWYFFLIFNKIKKDYQLTYSVSCNWFSPTTYRPWRRSIIQQELSKTF